MSTGTTPLRAGALRAFSDGLGRVVRAPALLAGVWLLTAASALPLGLWMRGAVEADLGSSLAAAQAARGVNWEWWQEFVQRRPDAGETFEPSIIGFAAVLRNASALLDGEGPARSVLGATAVYLALWVFLLGGVLDRLARQRRVGTHGFFGACGVYFFRFLRLGVLAGAAYALLFLVVHPLVFDRLYAWLTRDLSVERTALVVRAGCYLLFGLGLAATVTLFDYAKVRAVVEDRRSMIGALVASARFIRRHPLPVAGVYLLTLALLLGVLACYALVAPAAGTASVLSLAWLLLAGQALVVGRLWVKLTGYAAGVALFQSHLAHAKYTAAPEIVWPDSPAVESLANAAPSRAAQPARRRTPGA